jgi:formylglycine-generating enzyme
MNAGTHHTLSSAPRPSRGVGGALLEALRLMLLAALGLGFSTSLAAAAEPLFVDVPAGAIESTLKYLDRTGPQPIAAFSMLKKPVTNADFLRFVQRHEQWQRGKAPAVFAESRYLQHWPSAQSLASTTAPALALQPVVNVSWFAASAYCESLRARLPTWNEWEYVAAADETRVDARSDPAWREQILSWYAKPSGLALAAVGQRPANVYGVHDVHGLIWEWTDDYASMMVTSDSREQSAEDRLQFCGAGAIAVTDRDDYAVLMRVAMLSSMQAQGVTSNLGFRCVRDRAVTPPTTPARQ